MSQFVALIFLIVIFLFQSCGMLQHSCIQENRNNFHNSSTFNKNWSNMPSNFNLEEMNFVKEYHCIVESMKNGTLPPKFLIFRQKDGTGWGNQMRGLLSAFNIAILTKRIFIVDFPCLTELFSPPDGIEFGVVPKISKQLIRLPSQYPWIKPTKKNNNAESPSQTLVYQARFRELWSVPDWQNLSLTSADLNKDITAQYWVSSVGVSIDYGITMNPNYQSLINFLYRTESRYVKTMMLGKFLLGKVRKNLAVEVDEFKSDIGLHLRNNTPFLVLQYRSFVDGKSKNRKEKDFISCSNRILEKLKTRYKAIYFTTDDEVLRNSIPRSIIFGNVITKSGMFVHTARSRTCLNRGVIDWYMLGEGDGLITTGTSYAVSAVARRGGLIDAYTTGSRYAAKGCHIMREIEKPPQYDLHF